MSMYSQCVNQMYRASGGFTQRSLLRLKHELVF